MAITAEKTNSGRLAIVIVGVLLVAGVLIGLLWFELRRVLIGHTPAQPVSGYTGDWKMHGTHGEEERPLPPAAEIWLDYERWQPTNNYTSKFYIARLGHSERQLKFQRTITTPMTLGDRVTTRVTFLYRDPTNGDYSLYWDLVGEHDANFLKFDDTERWFQLKPLGAPEQPPLLQILGIEGFAPFYN